jgi:hypothetical protein
MINSEYGGLYKIEELLYLFQGSGSFRLLGRSMGNQIPNRVNSHIPHTFTSDHPLRLNMGKFLTKTPRLLIYLIN